MEAVIFIGLQAAGKTTFYKERFFDSHVRISLDLLKTRHRERLFLRVCLASQQRFVVDNTNPTAEERARYIAPAKAARFRVVGYYFPPDVEESLRRNEGRAGRARVPPPGIIGTYKKLQPPALAEGFDVLSVVWLDEAGNFAIEEWPDEV